MSEYPDEVTILLVEDNDFDAEAVSRSFCEQRIANPVVRARDGIDALEMLRGKTEVDLVERPFLILLDINMPRMDGLEFLRELRADNSLKKSIVFILTTSNDDRDKFQAYEQNVAGYVLKSNVGEDFVNLLTILRHYWRIVEFPPA